jgi:WD40 repeat protein
VGHEGPVSDLLVSQDGRWLVSASALRPSANVTGDGSFWIWDLQAADVQKSGQKYKFNNDASAIDIDPLGEWVAAGSENQQLRLIPFDVDLKEAYKTKYGVNLDALNETQMEECVGLSPDARWLKYINSNGTGFLLETKSKTRESVEEEICESYFSPNGRWLIAPVSDGIRIYDLQGSKIGTPQKYLTNPHTYPQHWFFSGDETLFITDDGTRDTSGDWTPEQNTATYMIRLQEQRQVRPDPAIRSFAVSPDSKWLAGVSADGKGDFAIYDLSAGKPAENVTVLLPAAAKLGLPEEAEELVYAVVQQEMDQDVVHFSPDSQWVTLTTCADGRKIHIWNLLAKNPASSEIVVALPESKDCSGEVEISYGENASWLGMLVDGVVKLIDISRTPAREIDIQKLVTSGAIQQISFSPDGRWLALLDELGQVRAIDLRDANLTAIQLNPLFYKIDKIGFDKGSHVLSGSTTLGNTLIWEMDDPYAFPLVSNGGSYTNSDGQWLFSLSYDQLLEAICPQIGRNLSRSEWLLYGFSEDYRATCPQFPTE